MTVLYHKVGRKYVVYGRADAWDADVMRAGQWRMTYCYADGGRRYSYDVTPDTASFAAACELSAAAMEAAINDAAIAHPQEPAVPYTLRQRSAIERARVDLAAVGLLTPIRWNGSSARDIAQAGIDAVKNWGSPGRVKP